MSRSFHHSLSFPASPGCCALVGTALCSQPGCRVFQALPWGGRCCPGSYLGDQCLVLCHELVQVFLVLVDAFEEVGSLVLQLVQLLIHLREDRGPLDHPSHGPPTTQHRRDRGILWGALPPASSPVLAPGEARGAPAYLQRGATGCCTLSPSSAAPLPMHEATQGLLFPKRWGDLGNVLIIADLVKKADHCYQGGGAAPLPSRPPQPRQRPRTRVLFLLRVSSSVCKFSSSRAAVSWDFWASAHFASLSSN